MRVLSTGLANIVRIGHNPHLTLKPNINMNLKSLPFHKRNEYLQRKYHQFKNIESAEQQTIYYIYYSTVVCFSIGILADLCVYLMRNNLLLAICNILSLGLFALFTYLLIRKKARIVSLLNSVFYTIQGNILISMYNRIYLPPEEAGFFLSQDLIIGMVTCGLASISVKRHTVIILSLSPVLLYLGIGLYTSSDLYLMNFPSLTVAYIFPPVMLAKLQEILRSMHRQKKRMTSELKLWAAFNALHLQPSNKEIQFCCLILENKTTEEIAELQYIAPSTVRSNRSRLRQKLQIGQETDLQEYLSELIKKDFD